MNRVKLGILSLSEGSPAGDDRPYLAWHQLDHMPEQYQIPGIVWAQRWAASPTAAPTPAAGSTRFHAVRNVVLYLMGDPVRQSIDDFFELGSRLGGLGRIPGLLPSPFLGGLHFLEAHASPAALVSAEVVPFRPNRGVYLVLEEVTDRRRLDAHVQRMHTEHLPAVAATPGVAGTWSFGTTGHYRDDRFTAGRYRLTACYLDADPHATARRLADMWRPIWEDDDAAVTPLLASPFESLARWDWDRFGPTTR